MLKLRSSTPDVNFIRPSIYDQRSVSARCLAGTFPWPVFRAWWEGVRDRDEMTVSHSIFHRCYTINLNGRSQVTARSSIDTRYRCIISVSRRRENCFRKRTLHTSGRVTWHCCHVVRSTALLSRCHSDVPGKCGAQPQSHSWLTKLSWLKQIRGDVNSSDWCRLWTSMRNYTRRERCRRPMAGAVFELFSQDPRPGTVARGTRTRLGRAVSCQPSPSSHIS